MPRIAKNGTASKPAAKKSKSETTHVSIYNKPHMVIPIEDSEWAIEQTPSIQQFWLECWRCDPFGSRWIQLTTKLKRSAFMAAKKILESQGLFSFKPNKSIGDGRETVCWLVQNQHGSRVKEFWRQSTSSEMESTDMDSSFIQADSNLKNDLSIKANFMSTKMDVSSTSMELESTQTDSIASKTLVHNNLQNHSVTSQEHLSNSSKELLRCEDNTKKSSNASLSVIFNNYTEFFSSSNDVAAAIAPFAGASPEEEKTLENHEINEQLEAAASGTNIPLWVWQQAYDNACFHVRVKSLIAYRSDLNLKIENHRVVRR